MVHFFGLLAGRSAAALLVVLAGVWGFGFVQGSGSSAFSGTCRRSEDSHFAALRAQDQLACLSSEADD